jgi:arsenite methyltransferase
MEKFTYHDFFANLGVGGAHPGGLTLSKKALAKEQLKPSSKVLDVGCGKGRLLHFWHEPMAVKSQHSINIR